MDADLEIFKHINQVRRYLNDVMRRLLADIDRLTTGLPHMLQIHTLTNVLRDLLLRADLHDVTKLQEPERFLFTQHTPQLHGTVYDSDEYRAFLKALAPALEHHYATFSHHPEHFSNGIAGMTLIDLLEMLADWHAAAQRYGTGSLAASLEVNQKRYGYSDTLKGILTNTAYALGFIRPSRAPDNVLCDRFPGAPKQP
jgi:hypothetical protein